MFTYLLWTDIAADIFYSFTFHKEKISSWSSASAILGFTQFVWNQPDFRDWEVNFMQLSCAIFLLLEWCHSVKMHLKSFGIPSRECFKVCTEKTPFGFNSSSLTSCASLFTQDVNFQVFLGSRRLLFCDALMFQMSTLLLGNTAENSFAKRTWSQSWHRLPTLCKQKSV